MEGQMRLEARFYSTTADLSSAVKQLEERVGKELTKRAAALPDLQRVDQLVLFLAIETHGKFAIRRSYRNGVCIVSYGTRYKSWFDATWQQRVHLVVDAYLSTIKGVPKTRITEQERESLLQLLAEVREHALSRAPDKVVKAVSTVFQFMPDGYDPEAPSPPPSIVKLYKRVGGEVHYREAWIEAEHHIVIEHDGICGTRGRTRRIGGETQRGAQALLNRFIAAAKSDGYRRVAESRMQWLIVEYAADRTGPCTDLERRHRIEQFVDQELGWHGLGHCDGGSIGMGTMEIACLVVDFDIAKATLERALAVSDFPDLLRIYRQR
jgi:hypothetical protein